MNVDPQGLRESMKDMIAYKAIMADTILFHAGVSHSDCNTQNLIIVIPNHTDEGTPIDEVQLEVKLIDFNLSTIRQDTLPLLEIWRTRMQSPIVRWYRSGNFDGWRTSKEDQDPERWLWEKFKDDPRFIPVIESVKGRGWPPVHMGNRDSMASVWTDGPIEEVGQEESAMGETADTFNNLRQSDDLLKSDLHMQIRCRSDISIEAQNA